VSLPENLARLQAERGETNYRLAKEIDVSQTSIKNWKDGARRPHPRQIKKLANHFGARGRAAGIQRWAVKKCPAQCCSIERDGGTNLRLRYVSCGYFSTGERKRQ